jgi:hypothetical protein
MKKTLLACDRARDAFTIKSSVTNMHLFLMDAVHHEYKVKTISRECKFKTNLAGKTNIFHGWHISSQRTIYRNWKRKRSTASNPAMTTTVYNENPTRESSALHPVLIHSLAAMTAGVWYKIRWSWNLTYIYDIYPEIGIVRFHFRHFATALIRHVRKRRGGAKESSEGVRGNIKRELSRIFM